MIRTGKIRFKHIYSINLRQAGDRIMGEVFFRPEYIVEENVREGETFPMYIEEAEKELNFIITDVEESMDTKTGEKLIMAKFKLKAVGI